MFGGVDSCVINMSGYEDIGMSGRVDSDIMFILGYGDVGMCGRVDPDIFTYKYLNLGLSVIFNLPHKSIPILLYIGISGYWDVWRSHFR